MSDKWTPLVLVLATVMVASAIGQAVGAANGSAELSIFAAAAFVGALLRMGWQVNRPWWDAGRTHSGVCHDIGPAPVNAQPMLAHRNANLVAMGYLWGAVSLFAVYLGTPLKWQHGWQYATGMAIIAAAIMFAARQFSHKWTPMLQAVLTWVTLLHGWAALGGLFWLAATWKLFSQRSDWPANIVFVGGGILVCVLGAMSLRTTRLLASRKP